MPNAYLAKLLPARRGLTVEDDDHDDHEQSKHRGPGLLWTVIRVSRVKKESVGTWRTTYEGSLEGELVAVDALALASVVEANEREIDASPSEQACTHERRVSTPASRPSQPFRWRLTGDGRQVGEVTESGGRSSRDVHVGEQADERRKDQAVHGETVLGAAAEDGRSLAVAGETAV